MDKENLVHHLKTLEEIPAISISKRNHQDQYEEPFKNWYSVSFNSEDTKRAFNALNKLYGFGNLLYHTEELPSSNHTFVFRDGLNIAKVVDAILYIFNGSVSK